MKNKTLLYIPAAILFIFAIAVLVTHYANMPNRLNLDPPPYLLSFGYFEGVVNLGENVKAEGLEIGDKIKSLNGIGVTSQETYKQALKTVSSTEPVALEIERTIAKGKTESKMLKITPVKLEKNSVYYFNVLIQSLFIYLLPTFCILLGFWVVLVRPQDFLAWLLLFVLLGLSSFSLELYKPGTLVGAYRNMFFGTWALSMFLFGIYFPERWSFDKRFPWAKWLIILPLSFQAIMSILYQIDLLIGFDLLESMKFSGRFNDVLGIINMFAIGMFFSALSHKSFALKNPDARRRLKLMVIGTMFAMTPTFSIVLYKLITQAKGSFFDIAPAWYVILALFALMMFPLTMAYVIVVQRAMNVSVVVRQGLQYALAKNGIRVLQILLLVGVILGTFYLISSGYAENVSAQIGFVVGGLALIPLIDYIAGNLRVWIDRKFFREAYNAEQILSELSDEVRTMVETKPLLETVSNKISESLHVPQVTLLLKKGDTFQPAYAVGYEDIPTVFLGENDKTIEKISKNESLIIYQDVVDSWVNREVQKVEREALQKLNSQLLLPIGVKDVLAGVISLSPKLSEEPFTPNDLRLLKSVASQTGLALENSRLTATIAKEAAQKERLNRELEIAREVQERLFPQELPEIDGLDYHGTCRTALDVGGDYYDFLEFADGRFGIAIGDISGKGIGASLMMASLQASLRGQSLHFKNDLAGLMAQINHLLYDASTSNRYATFFYSQYDPKTRNLIYVTAGHDPPYLLRRQKDDIEIIKLDKGGAVVGMLPPMLVEYEQGEITLQTGDLIVSSTDGITEAMNPNEEEWGEPAMLEEIKKVYGKSAQEIAEHIISKADEFASGAKQHDDMTMIVIRVL